MFLRRSKIEYAMTKLSVNLNKIALLRNQRDVGYPDLYKHAMLILKSGADGLTVHPRPDERHIRKDDIPLIEKAISDFGREGIEFNIEGYPSEDFIELVKASRCDQVTLVPDAPDAKTSDDGWDIEKHGDMLKKVIADLQNSGKRVSLFVNPDETSVRDAKKVGANRIEFFTGPFAKAYDIRANSETRRVYEICGGVASEVGIEVNAGHDLCLKNLEAFLDTVENCLEVSIGHAITDDALQYGWKGAVERYQEICKKPKIALC
tara:strand:+ start:808 stop:1596 length:789 start_codon:yes stop_codon:yes gene_type:complete